MKVGILGAGQLAQLLAQAAKNIDVETVCFAGSKDYSAADDSEIFVGQMDDFSALEEFAKSVDFITFENENIEEPVIDFLAKVVDIAPAKVALLTAQDRLLEKQLFADLAIPCAKNAVIDSQADLDAVITDFDGKGILKTRRLGYDGKGQVRIHSAEDAAGAMAELQGQASLLEGFVNFDSECSQIAARNRNGDIVFYSLVDNEHESGILRRSVYPGVRQDLAILARDYTRRILEKLDYVGVLALELFVQGDQLIANEIAPRVHNSGHVTIEATNCSQFENHLRAVCGLPLVDPEVTVPYEMRNVIGEWGDLGEYDKLYDYNKSPRPRRKLGHVVHKIS